MNYNPYEMLAGWLENEAGEIRKIERKAHLALYNEKDEPLYRDLMKAKALKLADLAESVSPYISALDTKDREIVGERMERFSISASKALEIGSVFFMSALLYPEDYKDGEKNDLENFADRVKRLG